MKRLEKRASLNVFFIVSVLALGSRSAMANPINLVSDGSFESNALGFYGTGALGPWQLQIASGSAGIYDVTSYNGTNVTDGLHAFDMGMGGTTTGNALSQTLATVAGHSYHLTFDWGSEYDWGTNSTVSIGSLSASLIDQPFDNSAAQDASRPWIQHSAAFDFVASGNNVLQFSDQSTAGTPGPFSYFGGLALDNISVTENAPAPTDAPVPEPATLVLFGSGLSTLILRRRGRDRETQRPTRQERATQ